MPNLKVLELDLDFKTIIKWKKQKNIQVRNSNGLRKIVCQDSKREYLKRVATLATLFKYIGLEIKGVSKPFDIPICRGSLSCHNNFPSIAFKGTILIEIPIKTPSNDFFRIV